ncbi:hypothetical protein AB1K18_20015 [Peribacillus simplex]|uniref:hypothetical protein n=1 Tax=Peribacillus simplex TaxID=1478 RepID=UPI003B8D3EEA
MRTLRNRAQSARFFVVDFLVDKHLVVEVGRAFVSNTLVFYDFDEFQLLYAGFS